MNSRIGIGPVVGVLLMLMAFQGVSGLQHYNGSCNTTSDCVNEFTCRNGRCRCPWEEPDMYYDEDLTTCISYEGWLCTVLKRTAPGLLRCNLNSTCTDELIWRFSIIYGICRCNPGFVPSDDGKRCFKKPDQPPNGTTAMEVEQPVSNVCRPCNSPVGDVEKDKVCITERTMKTIVILVIVALVMLLQIYTKWLKWLRNRRVNAQQV